MLKAEIEGSSTMMVDDVMDKMNKRPQKTLSPFLSLYVFAIIH